MDSVLIMSESMGAPRRRLNAVIGVLAGVGLNALAVLLALRVLGPDGRGQMVAMSLTSTMVYVVFGLGLPAAAVYLVAKDSEAAGVYTGNALLASAVLPMIALGAALLVPDGFVEGAGLGLQVGTLRMAVALSPALFAFQQLAAVAQGMGDYSLLRDGRVVQGAAVAMGMVAAPLVTTATPQSMFYFWVAGYAIGAAYLAVRILRRSAFGVDLSRMRKSITYGVRAFWTQVWEFVNMRGDQLLVAAIAPPSVLGVYATAVSLSEILFHVPNALSQVVFSDTAAGVHADPRAMALREGRGVFGLTVAGGVALLVVSWLVVLPLTGLTAQELLVPLGLMVVPISLLSSARMLGASLMGGGRPELPGLAAAASFVVTIAMDLALVPRLGAVGAALGVSAGYLTGAAVLALTFSGRLGSGLRRTSGDSDCEVAK